MYKKYRLVLLTNPQEIAMGNFNTFEIIAEIFPH